jgi:hypothetical protein
MVKEMFEKIKRGELEFNVETVKQTLAKGYRDCDLPSVAKTVELFLDEVKTP